MNSFAIVETGGKQYRVHEGDTIRVESIEGDEGATIDLESVKLISQDLFVKKIIDYQYDLKMDLKLKLHRLPQMQVDPKQLVY